MKRLLVAIGLLAGGAVSALAQTAPPAPPAPLPLKHAPEPTAPAVTAADLMSRLYVFADDSMMGREAGTPGHIKGTEYIERELRRLSLEPAGDRGSFFQDFTLETIAPQVKVSVGNEALTPGTDPTQLAARFLHECRLMVGAEHCGVVRFDREAGEASILAYESEIVDRCTIADVAPLEWFRLAGLIEERQGAHFHFVDGAGGGYAAAALALKQSVARAPRRV